MMFGKTIRMAVGAAAITGAAAADDRHYEYISAEIDGRLTVAFVDGQGTAVALALGRDRPEIIRGLAAGAILSDLRERIGFPNGFHGGHAHMNAPQLAAVIDDLPQITALQRQQLKAWLAV